jgi:hypothetical protein
MVAVKGELAEFGAGFFRNVDTATHSLPGGTGLSVGSSSEGRLVGLAAVVNKADDQIILHLDEAAKGRDTFTHEGSGLLTGDGQHIGQVVTEVSHGGWFNKGVKQQQKATKGLEQHKVSFRQSESNFVSLSDERIRAVLALDTNW